MRRQPTGHPEQKFFPSPHTSVACTCVRRAALALAAGCVFRAKGGIALAAAVGGTASTLIALAASSPPSVHLWLLHGLWLVAGAAGLAFLPHVRPSLDLALAVLLAEGAAAVPGLRPAAGDSHPDHVVHRIVCPFFAPLLQRTQQRQS